MKIDYYNKYIIIYTHPIYPNFSLLMHLFIKTTHKAKMKYKQTIYKICIIMVTQQVIYHLMKK